MPARAELPQSTEATVALIMRDILNGKHKLRDLSKTIGANHISTVRAIMKRLHNEGLVERVANGSRFTEIHITKLGRAWLAFFAFQENQVYSVDYE